MGGQDVKKDGVYEGNGISRKKVASTILRKNKS